MAGHQWVLVDRCCSSFFCGFRFGGFALLEVCRTLGNELKFSTVFGYFLAGQFVGNFLPTTVGGDILRVSRLGAEIRDHSSAFASVVIE